MCRMDLVNIPSGAQRDKDAFGNDEWSELTYICEFGFSLSPLVISFKSRYQNTSLRSDRESKVEEERKSQRMWKGGENV